MHSQAKQKIFEYNLKLKISDWAKWISSDDTYKKLGYKSWMGKLIDEKLNTNKNSGFNEAECLEVNQSYNKLRSLYKQKAELFFLVHVERITKQQLCDKKYGIDGQKSYLYDISINTLDKHLAFCEGWIGATL